MKRDHLFIFLIMILIILMTVFTFILAFSFYPYEEPVPKRSRPVTVQEQLFKPAKFSGVFSKE